MAHFAESVVVSRITTGRMVPIGFSEVKPGRMHVVTFAWAIKEWDLVLAGSGVGRVRSRN